MSYALNAVVAPDNYSAAATIENVPIDSLVMDVNNQSIYYQLKIGITGGGGVWEATEAQAIPGSRVIESDTPGEIAGIRFRAVIPAAQLSPTASQAVVTIRTSP